MTACSNGVDGQTPGPDNGVEILKWLENTTFHIIVTAVFGTTTADIQTHIEDLLAEFRDAFSISSGLHAQAEMAWETILPSHLFFGLIPLDDVRKTKSSMQACRAEDRSPRLQHPSILENTPSLIFCKDSISVRSRGDAKNKGRPIDLPTFPHVIC